MSLSIALFNAVSGLHLNQSALDVAAQNIANVNTEGYSRKIVNQESVVLGGMGAGVRLTEISRNVNEFVVKDMRSALSQVSDSRVQNDFYARMQDLFGTLESDTSISAFITNLATRFQALVNNPEDMALQTEVVNQADLLAQQFRTFASKIQEMRLAADRQISDAASEIQLQTQRVFELNIKIAEHKALNLPATDLQDQRDNAVNKISELMGVNYFERATGELVLMTEAGRLMVDRTQPTFTHPPASSFDTLIAWAAGGSAVSGIELNGTDLTAEIATGRIAGLVEVRDTILPNLASQLEELAGALQTEINALHNQGTAFPGNASLTGTRTMLGTERPAWSGTFRVAVADQTGALVQFHDVNLAAITDVNALITDINTNLAGNLTASLSTTGKLVLQPDDPNNRVALAESTSAVPVGNRTVGAAAFFGLNDLFVNGADYDVYGSDYQSSRNTALGLAGTLTFTIGATTKNVAYAVGDTLDDIRNNINAEMALVPAVAISASVDTDGSGFRLRLTADTSTGLQNFFISDSNANGVLNSLNLTPRDGRMASSITLRSDIRTDPTRIAHGQVSGTAALLVGQVIISEGDNTIVQGISNRFNTAIDFPPTGLLGGSKRTIADYGAQILALNASQARNTADLRTSREFLYENLSNTAMSESGVNLDEEMANLVMLENAYAASARVIDVTSELFDVLAQIIR